MSANDAQVAKLSQGIYLKLEAFSIIQSRAWASLQRARLTCKTLGEVRGETHFLLTRYMAIWEQTRQKTPTSDRTQLDKGKPGVSARETTHQLSFIYVLTRFLCVIAFIMKLNSKRTWSTAAVQSMTSVPSGTPSGTPTRFADCFGVAGSWSCLLDDCSGSCALDACFDCCALDSLFFGPCAAAGGCSILCRGHAMSHDGG